MCQVITIKFSLNYNDGNTLRDYSMSYFIPKAYTGNVIYPLSGKVEMELRTCDSQSSIIQLLRSNPEKKLLSNFLNI